MEIDNTISNSIGIYKRGVFGVKNNFKIAAVI